jgi:hypothetical protein
MAKTLNIIGDILPEQSSSKINRGVSEINKKYY